MTVVLALDLARVTGWACGRPGAEPAHGRVQFASPGSSHEAVFAGAMTWMRGRIEWFKPELLLWEAPLAGFKGGRTTNDATTILFGLPAVVGAVAFEHGIYDIRKADTRDVRIHFIGKNLKRVQAKVHTKMQCRAMGWEVDDDNEADALATWHFMCSLISPKLAMRPTPLFGRR